MVSVLRITGIEKEDTGRVVCIASNGVKDAIQSLATNLIVNRKFRIPFFDRSTCSKLSYLGITLSSRIMYVYLLPKFYSISS